MLDWQSHRKLRIFIKVICIVLISAFVSYDLSWAGATEVLSFNNLASLSRSPFVPPTLKYLSVNEANPRNYFNFLLDKGQLPAADKGVLNKEAKQLINYFFLGITLPDNVFWVNLKPTESDRITSEQLSRTDLGRTLLEQDFRLKRDMSQYLNPQNPIGKQFWEKLYSTLGKDKVKKSGITTSNRVWIVPAEAVVVETEDGALLAKSSLKVLLESEYAALKFKPNTQPFSESSSGNSDNLQVLTEQLMKEIIIPAITKDVNESKNYAPLRQIYQSLILAQWFKRKHKNADSAYAQAINKGNLKGLESQLPWEKQQIWQEYLKSYKQGEYRIQDKIFGLKRMYFSGGVLFDLGAASVSLRIISQKELPEALKQNPDLLNPESLKDSLVVITEGQSNQQGPGEQPLIQDINVVSSPASLSKKTAIQRITKEEPEIGSETSKPEKQKATPSRINYKPFLSTITAVTLALYLPSVALAQGKDVTAKTFSSFSEFFTQPVTILVGIGLVAGYLIFRLIKKFTTKEARPIAGAIVPAPSVQPQAQPTQSQLTRQPEIIVPQQSQNNISAVLRRELETGIQQLNDLVARSSRDALAGSFRPTGPAELPLPIPISMLNQHTSDRDKIVHILENMQMMMDGTDEKVLRDFERAIDNARDRVTEQALDEFDRLSNDQIYQLLTQGYLAELQREFQRIIENQIQHMVRFHTPSPEEQNLYVSEDINERYPRLPRYLKWLLTNNPQLESDPLVREWLNTIEMRMSRIPAFPEMIQEYSKRALNKSLYLNPELAMRVILYLSRGGNLDGLSETQARAGIQQELARNLPEDVAVTDVSVEEDEEDILELPQAPQPRSLPAPDIGKTDNLKARLKALLDDYQHFLTKFTEQEAVVRKAESDLAELSEGFEEAKRQNDKVIISALRPAVEGLASKLRKAKETLARLEQEKARYEEQINQIRRESGGSAGTALYAVEPLSLGVGAVFVVMFGIPLYITKKILNKWYNTTAGKTLGILASLSTTILGYYIYYTSLTPKIQEVFTNFSNADWAQLSTFFIIWPIAIIAGIFGGKFGRGISHERLYWKANSAFKAGRIDEAIDLVNKAIKLHPKDSADYRLLAECQRSKKRFDEAVTVYQKALEFEPNNSSTHNNLGVVYVEKGDDAKAIECYRRSLELESNDAIVLGNLGRALHKKGQLLEAAKVLQRAQQIKPSNSVTEELNGILQQTGTIPKAPKPSNLAYGKTLAESLRLDKEESWLRNKWGIREEAWWSVVLGWALGGLLMWLYPYGQHWNLGTSEHPTWIGVTVWIVEIGVMPFTGLLQLWFMEKFVDGTRKVYRFLKFPVDYRKLQKVNLLPSEELSDSDLKSVALIYARISKEYLETIFRSWMEAGQEEKVARLFKFGKWKSEKTRIYGDVAEYKRVSRVAATKFANTAQEQKAIFDGIDREKERLAQKGIANAVALMKDILPQITEHSRNKDEFWHWLSLVIGLPKNILDQGQRQVLTVFTDLIEFDRAQEESFNKFGTANQEANSKVKTAINGLVQKLERDGLNYPGILKKALAEINKASRNLNEFLFWVNEVMQLDKQLWSSGNFLGLLQNLISYVRAKEEASKKFCHSPEETSRLFQTVDNLREDLRTKQVSGDVSMLKDVIPRVTEASRNLAEFLEYIAVLKSFDKNMWRGTQSVLQAFNNHVAYKQARENAVAKFTQNDASRQKFLSDIDNLREQLVQKGFPQASDLLKDILPELTKTCRSKEEFIYWLGELVGLNTTVWRSGVQIVINNFNDLAGFKQAKEMATEKLCANQREKDDLAGTIDSLKAKLEEKRPSCAGLIKDVILEILRDIDSLASPQYRKTDFVWWLTMCVNFEAQTWAAGTKQVLAGYQELKDYVKQRRELTARFTTNSEEQQRLASVWDTLDKTANFSRPASISLLRNTLGKIANFATNPREFVFWIGTLSELNNEVLEVFCRDIETVFAYYKEKGKSRDFNHLPAVLNQYHETYHQTVLITINLLDTLTDPSLGINKRVEKVSQFLIEQKIVKLGAPPNLVGLRDAVSFDELIGVVGEDTLRSFIQYHPPIKRAMERMGREGVYTYAEAQRPAYYKHFLEEANGLRQGFNQPGEKFRVSRLGNIVSWSAEEEAQVMPISDNVQALKQLIQYLRMEWPNLYDNFVEPKRELIKGRPLEEFVTSDTVSKMAQQLLNKVQGWQFSEQQRTAFILKIMEILAFSETADLRTRINGATDEFNRLKLVVQYWERVLESILKYKRLQEKSKFYSPVAKFIRQKIATISNKLDVKGKEILQFHLSGGTLADFFKGWVSQDCTKNTDGEYPHYLDTQAFVMDPGCFLFKVIEENRWVGNIYTFVFKDKNGKFYLYIDMFQIKSEHPLAQNGSEESKKEFALRFIQEFTSYLGSQGFDYLLISNDPAQRGIKDALRKAAKEKAGQNGETTLSLKKLGGTEFFSEAGVGEEYVQTISGNQISNGFQDVRGHRIEINKTTIEVVQQRQTELDYLERLLGEMSAEETRLLALIKENQTELDHINQKGREAANSGRNALAIELKNASEQKKAEIQKIEYELGELRAKIQEQKQAVERIRADLGMFKSKQGAGFASSPVGRSLLLMPIMGILSLFLSQPAQAQDLSSFDKIISSPFAPVLIVAGIIGLFGFLYYILNKFFPEKPKYEPYHGMSSQRPLYEEYKLPQDIDEQLAKVLAKVSPGLQGLIPRRIDIHLPFEVGIRRQQAVKALRLLFSELIEQDSVLEFIKTQPFYQDFKQRAKELGLSDDFDQPRHEYSFSIAKEEIQQEEDRRAEEFVENTLAKLKKEYRGVSEETILRRISDRKSYLSRKGFDRVRQAEFYEYYLLLKAYAYLRFQDKLADASGLLAEHKYLEALSLLEEFLRVGIGAELISLEPNAHIRDILNTILNRELEDVRWQFNRLTSSQVKKEQTSQAARDIQYTVELSDRSADDILRGVISGDCTAINGLAFYNTIPQFMFDPGFLDFKILQEDKWVGNVYAIVAERNNNPVLIIDAIQLPVWGRSWPVSVRSLSDKALEKVVEYAQAQGFAQVLMSSFVSNFNAIHEHFGAKYPTQAIEIEKVAGFEHLKSLGLWDGYASRNEYLETFSPQWNYGLKRVDPNNPRQTLLLRRIWERSPPSQQSEELPTEPTKASSPLKQDIRPQKDIGGLLKFIQRNFRKAVVTAALFIMLAVPNIANAARFESMPGPLPNQTQIVAVVEQGDTDWDIAGTAYQGLEGIGKGRYAAHAQWPRIYEANPQIHHRPNNALRPMYEDGGYYKDDRHIIVNIRPGDRLVIPGPVNSKAIGVEAPAQVQAQFDMQSAVQQLTTAPYSKEITPTVKAQGGTTHALIALRWNLQWAGYLNPWQAYENMDNMTSEQFQQALQGEVKAGLQKYVDVGKDASKNTQREIQRIFVTGKVPFAMPSPSVEKSPVAKPPEVRPPTSETKPPAVVPSQEQTQAQQEVQNLQQQKAQAEQELNQLQQQRQAAQADLENLQKQKTELTRQILDLKKQLADIQEQLRQAKDKIPSNLQSEEARRQALEQETRQLEQKKVQYAQDISALERQYKEAQDDLSRITAQKEKASQELGQLRQQSPQAQTQIKDLQSEIQRLETQKKQHQQELTQLQNQRDGLQKGVEQLNQDKDKLQEELRGLKQQIDQAKDILEGAKQKAQPNWQNFWGGMSWPEKAGIILLFLSGLGAIAAGIKLIKRWLTFKRLQREVERLQGEVKDTEARLGTLRAEEGDIIKTQQDAEKVKLEAEEEAKKVAAQQAQLETERERLEQEARDLQRQREEIEEQKRGLAELDKQKQAAQAEIEQLKDQRDGLQKSLAEAEQATQEAIRKAQELEEQAKAKTESFQGILTDEQRKLNEQLEAGRQEITVQLAALEKQLAEARARHERDMQDIEQEKAAAQTGLEGLRAERDETDKKIREMNETLANLTSSRNALTADLEKLAERQGSLEKEIQRLEAEKSKLEAAVTELRPVEVMEPVVEELFEEVIKVDEEANALLGKIAPLSNAHIHRAVIEQIEHIGIKSANIESIPLNTHPGHDNILVKIPASDPQYEHLPKIILNAHMDTIRDSGFWFIFRGRKERVESGALDDRVGVIAILQSLRMLKQKWEVEKIPHGPIWIIFTDLEEPPYGFAGAEDLKDKYQGKQAEDAKDREKYRDLFDNTYLIVTIDGPLVYPPNPDIPVEEINPFVIAGRYDKKDKRYQAFERAVSNLNHSNFHNPDCPASDGEGDHHIFREIIDKKTNNNLLVINLRAPHTDLHRPSETTYIEGQIVPMAQWISESVIELSKNLIPLKGRAGSTKGQGMLAPDEHAEVNEVISTAQQEGRGSLIWGDVQGWRQNKAAYAQDLTWMIASLRRYPKVRIPGLGVIDIPEVLAASNIVLIQPRNNSPPGLVVKSRDSYQIAHSGEVFNSIYIDEIIYKQLYSFEIALLLAHEAILLGAKQIAVRKHIPWTVDLAEQVHRFAEEYEIQIVGRSSNGRGSRFDDRIEELLDFANLRRRVQVQPMPETAKPKPKESQESPVLMPEPQRKQETPQELKPTLEYPEAGPDIIDNLRKLFLEGLFKDVSANLPAKLDDFPPPLAQEIRQAYELGKVKGMPLDADFMVALTLFFSKLFPNHADDLVRYMKNLSIYLVDNTRSTYGATLSGNTFYIQRSCIEDLLGRPVTVEEIYQGIRNKDPRICVALFRIVIHEIGSAFFKLSHPANQELEELFLAMLSKSRIELSPNAQQEINTVNRTRNLDDMARIDWAQKRNKPLNVDYAKLDLGNLLPQDKTAMPSEQGSEPGGIDLSKIEITLKDEKFVSNLNPADLKILRAAKALKQGQESLAVLYIHEVRLILKDNILAESDITQRVLFQNLLSQMERKELLNLEAVAFCRLLQGK